LDDNPVETLELQKKIDDSIEIMPPERKKIFLMSRYDGLKYKEIAEKLGISVKTVEAQMGKALKFLREELKEFMVILILIMVEILLFFYK
jgi:RNA polymerase sigma-70 factor (ECF subfamily)